jgi:hypothetical protein
MRICPTLNNNIITNNYKTELSMTVDAPNATDHDDDGKRIASSNSYDLPNQEDNDNDNDVTMTEDAPYATVHDDKDDDDDDVSFVPLFLLNVTNELGRSILTRSINGYEDNLPDHDNDDSFLPPGLLTLFGHVPSTTGFSITFRLRCACYTCNYAYSAIPRDKENSFEIIKN